MLIHGYRLAYLLFDSILVLFVSVVISIIFVASAPNAWYFMGELFVCFVLYGITSTLLSYVISRVARSQLSAFAFSAGGQA
jgi:ATP-binding cassette subfamily A (ABC1) protein 3